MRAGQQLEGADAASQVFGFGPILALGSRAAHLEADGATPLGRTRGRSLAPSQGSGGRPERRRGALAQVAAVRFRV